MSWICGYGRDEPTDEVPVTFGEWTTCIDAIMASDQLSDLTAEMALILEITNYESYLIAGPVDGQYLTTFDRRVEAMRSADRMNFDFVPIDAPEIRSFREWAERTGRRSMESEHVERDRYEHHAQAIEEYAGILERSPRDLAFFRDVRKEFTQMDRRELCAAGWESRAVNPDSGDVSPRVERGLEANDNPEDEAFYREFYSEPTTAEEQSPDSPETPEDEASDVSMPDAEQHPNSQDNPEEDLPWAWS